MTSLLRATSKRSRSASDVEKEENERIWKMHIVEMNELIKQHKSKQQSPPPKAKKKWEYSAPDIPESHLIERGYTEEEIQLTDGNLIQCLKSETHRMRRGDDIGSLQIGNRYIGEDHRQYIIEHDNLFLPHWKELADAIQLYEFNEGELHLESIELAPAVLDTLTPSLKRKKFESYELRNNNFTSSRDGIDFVLAISQSNPSLKEFLYAGNQINNLDVDHLFRGLKGHPCLEVIRLYNCRGASGNGYNILYSAISHYHSNYLHINLTSNNINTKGQTHLSDFLVTNPPLKYLNLSYNRLDNNDAMMIAASLKHNTNLRGIYLQGNDITDEGKDALYHAVFDGTTLNNLSDCNHACCLVWTNLPLQNFLPLSLRENRAVKLYHLLSMRNEEGSNVHHLNLEFEDEAEDSIKLVPNILDCVQKYSEVARYSRQKVSASHPVFFPNYDVILLESKPLSIMYEIVRGWQMPALYENKSPHQAAAQALHEPIIYTC